MIYLDYQATTPLAPEARDAMLRWLDGPGGTGFGNPHSPHRMGRQAKAAIEMAREQVAALFPAGGKVIFTSGATEAINLAIRGSGQDGSVSVSAIEHAAVLDTARAAGSCHVLNVAQDGQCNTRQDLPADTRLVCLMQVNNEIGTIQPTVEWHRKAKQHNALYFCDAVQAYGRIEVTGADMIAISAHKFHGPKGVGALWVRDGVGLEEVQTGGGQEFGLRSGTLSPALIAGMGAAAAEAKDRMEQDREHIEMLWDMARGLFADWTLNGSEEARWHGNLNIRRKGLDVNRLMSDVRDVMFSAGSACASGSGRTSHVLEAIGCSKAQAKASIRLGFGRYTTQEEIEQAAARINMAAKEQGL
ncbi:cysteine desulfurase [Qipengyuania flava]|jgi:cysteine desulfurase|uniref:Cysteine desulfurase n=1 Tax=Qipengyuania flava TaxID=192812 RepID=A0A5P6NAR7_9SPHN|nr:cysteine desulfurase family protein [Qipengyuania flava]MAH14384.1 cysteine desulfurase [Sphingomonadaceae bacterium]MEC7624480.1 cysteine desulfurase family protein [Pseudomonadota bacterium]OAN81442.1 aminotransferase [Erythrobacter sp. EhN03]NIJ61459.1 cysteine desulfurase [Qipengyuania flava]QFI63124.1 cysteine desulfurase [Qipengyuania flava]